MSTRNMFLCAFALVAAGCVSSPHVTKPQSLCLQENLMDYQHPNWLVQTLTIKEKKVVSLSFGRKLPGYAHSYWTGFEKAFLTHLPASEALIIDIRYAEQGQIDFPYFLATHVRGGYVGESGNPSKGLSDSKNVAPWPQAGFKRSTYLLIPKICDNFCSEILATLKNIEGKVMVTGGWENILSQIQQDLPEVSPKTESYEPAKSLNGPQRANLSLILDGIKTCSPEGFKSKLTLHLQKKLDADAFQDLCKKYQNELRDYEVESWQITHPTAGLIIKIDATLKLKNGKTILAHGVFPTVSDKMWDFTMSEM